MTWISATTTSTSPPSSSSVPLPPPLLPGDSGALGALGAFPLGDSGALGAFTDARHGDLRNALTSAANRRWHYLRQVHGATVVTVPGGDPPIEPPPGDGLVSAGPAALAVMVADCAPVLLASPEGVIAAVHCGWKPLAAGVVGAAASSMRARGAGTILGAIGPCIGPECYEFGEEDLEKVAACVDTPLHALRGVTASGRSALDLRAAVTVALERAEVEVAQVDPRCTACSIGLFSARARGDDARQGGLIWRS